MNWSKKETLQRGTIAMSAYAVAMILLYWWRFPSSCGEWNCDNSPVASILYVVIGWHASRLAMQPYNYWKAKKSDHVGNL